MTAKTESNEIAVLAREVFNKSLTADGLKKLKKKYPKNLVVDMSNDEEFKKARKSKTERNNITKNIKEKRIAFNKEVTDCGNGLADEVVDIFSVIVDPFEAEDKRRKEEAQRLENEKQALLQEQRNDINNIKDFVTLSIGKDSDYIQDSIEAVDLIEPEVFHQELIHEVIEVKKDTLTALTINLNDAIAREKLESERLKLEQEREEMEKKQRLVDQAAKIQERINNLKMIPTQFFKKTSSEIGVKIEALSGYDVGEDVFGDRVEEVKASISDVVSQLSDMKEMKLFQESQEAIKKEAEKKEIDKSLEFDSSIEFKEPEMQVISETLGEEIGESFLPEDEPKEPESKKSIELRKEAAATRTSECEIAEWLVESAGLTIEQSSNIASEIVKGNIPHVQVIK